MERRNLYRDSFSQDASSSDAPSIHTAAAVSTDDYMELQSQASGHSFSSGRVGMQDLDLNSQSDGFPFLDDYTGLLRDDGFPGGHGSRGQGGTSAGFQAPRTRGSMGGSSRGRSSVVRGRNREAGSGSSAAGRGQQLHGPRHHVGLPPLGIGGGMGGRGRGRLPPGRVSELVGMNLDAEEGDDTENGDNEDEQDNGSSKMSYDTANWNEVNTHIFCELYVDEMKLGNCRGGTMSNRGYQNIKENFKLRTNLNLKVRAFRNRMTSCKTLYNFHKETLKETGLGANSEGGIIASEAWWKEMLKGRTECKKFKKRLPEYIDYLHEMFHGVAVDGSTSCIPGEGDEKRNGNEDRNAGEEDMAQETPTSNGSRKRTNSTMSTLSSPEKGKKTKTPLLKVLKGLADTIQEVNKAQANAIAEMNAKKEEDRWLAREQKEEDMRLAWEQKENEKKHYNKYDFL